jgi:hypothetical protein
MNNNSGGSSVRNYLEREYHLRVLDMKWAVKTTSTPPHQPVGGEVTVVIQFTSDQMKTVGERLRSTPIENLALSINMEAKSKRLISQWVKEGNVSVSAPDILTMTMSTLQEVELLLKRILC